MDSQAAIVSLERDTGKLSALPVSDPTKIGVHKIKIEAYLNDLDSAASQKYRLDVDVRLSIVKPPTVVTENYD